MKTLFKDRWCKITVNTKTGAIHVLNLADGAEVRIAPGNELLILAPGFDIEHNARLGLPTFTIKPRG